MTPAWENTPKKLQSRRAHQNQAELAARTLQSNTRRAKFGEHQCTSFEIELGARDWCQRKFVRALLMNALAAQSTHYQTLTYKQ